MIIKWKKGNFVESGEGSVIMKYKRFLSFEEKGLSYLLGIIFYFLRFI